MSQTNVRYLGDAKTGSTADRVAYLRAKIATLESSPAVPSASVDVVEVDERMASVFPEGGITRKEVTQVSDCPALLVEIIAHVSKQGYAVAVIGWPELSLAQVAEDGDLSQVVAIPRPGSDPLAVLGIAVEGVDVVIYRTASAYTLTPAQARPLLAKIRGGIAAVMTVGMQVPSPVLRVDAHVTGFAGIGQGTGRIYSTEIAVRTSSKMRPRAEVVVVRCGSALSTPGTPTSQQGDGLPAHKVAK